jgi:hypothetical protein
VKYQDILTKGNIKKYDFQAKMHKEEALSLAPKGPNKVLVGLINTSFDSGLKTKHRATSRCSALAVRS